MFREEKIREGMKIRNEFLVFVSIDSSPTLSFMCVALYLHKVFSMNLLLLLVPFRGAFFTQAEADPGTGIRTT